MNRDLDGFIVSRTSRKPRMCERCVRPIEVGMTYERHTLPPWTGVNESPRWWTLPVHPIDVCFPPRSGGAS